MEARASFGRTGISKGFIAVVAVLITLGLAVMATAVAKNAAGSSATQTQTHAVVKAQPPSYAQSVKAQPKNIEQPGYRGGRVFVDDSLATSGTSVAPRVPQPRGGHGPIE